MNMNNALVDSYVIHEDNWSKIVTDKILNLIVYSLGQWSVILKKIVRTQYIQIIFRYAYDVHNTQYKGKKVKTSPAWCWWYDFEKIVMSPVEYLFYVEMGIVSVAVSKA